MVNGDGHFLGEDQTMERMETHYFYPKVGDRQSPEDWKDAGATDVRERARNVVRKTLAEHYPTHIDPATDAKIRQNFKIVASTRGDEAGEWAVVIWAAKLRGKTDRNNRIARE